MPSNPRSHTASNNFSAVTFGVLNVLDATTRTDKKFAERQLALTKRPPSQIVAIMHQQIERTGHRQMIGGPAVQHVEIGYALLNETNDLGIHDYAAFDASSFLYDARVAVRPVGAIHRE